MADQPASAAPSLYDYLQAARPVNPGVSDEAHAAYWQQHYAPAAQADPLSLPTLQDFLPLARAANPQATDAQSTTYWQQQYGSRGALLTPPQTAPSDYLKSLAAGAAEGAGAIAEGGGKILAAGVNAIAGTNLRAANPLQGAIDWLHNSQSPGAKVLEQGSEGQADIFDTSTWNKAFGDHPTLRGVVLRGLENVGAAAPNLAAALATGGASTGAQLALGAAVGGLQGYAMGSDQERARVEGMSFDDLAGKSKLYNTLIAQGKSSDEAKAAVADAAALGGGLGSGTVAGSQQALEDFLVGALTRGRLKLPVGLAARTGVAAGGAALSAGAGMAGMTAAQTEGANLAAGEDRPLAADSLTSFLQGAIAGGVTGGIVGALKAPPAVATPKPSDRILGAGDVDSAIDAFKFDVSNTKIAGPNLETPPVSVPDHTDDQILASQRALESALSNDDRFGRDENGNPTFNGGQLRAVPPQELGDGSDGRMSRSAYEAQSALAEAQGKSLVVYHDQPEFAFTGLANAGENSVFVADTNADPTAVVGHELQHVAGEGDAQQNYFKAVQDNLTDEAMDVAKQRHGDQATPVLTNEIRADIEGDAWADPTFHGKVLDAIADRLGPEKAQSYATKFLDSITDIIQKVRDYITGKTFLTPDGERLATKYVNNLEQVHQALAAAVADRFVTEGYHPPTGDTETAHVGPNTSQVLLTRALQQQQDQSAVGEVPGFQRTAEQKIAAGAKPIEPPAGASPELISALNAANKPPYLRTQEERINIRAIQNGTSFAPKAGQWSPVQFAPKEAAERSAGWTKSRIDRLIETYGTVFNNNTKARAAIISPDDFLKLTAGKYREGIEQQSRPLDVDKLVKEGQEPYLIVEPQQDGTLNVVGHEGRHRMVALDRAGIKKVPIAINDRYSFDKKPGAFKLTPQTFTGDTKTEVNVDTVPIHQSFRGELVAMNSNADISFAPKDNRESAHELAAKAGAGATKLQGLPDEPMMVAGRWYEPGPVKVAQDAANDYMAKSGLSYEPPKVYAKINPDRAKLIAGTFDRMPHAPNEPATKASYAAMARETLAQFQAIKRTGLKIDFIKPGEGDPYAASPRQAIQDVVEHNHLWVFPTEGGFGSREADVKGNPLLADSGEVINGHHLSVNDVFRIVHDYFGHIKDGVGFRAEGEENAWRSHAAMYSDEARPAMTTETRGQNSWVNYGPHGEKNRSANAAETTYADQKTGLLPTWASEAGRRDNQVEARNAPSIGENGSTTETAAGQSGRGTEAIGANGGLAAEQGARRGAVDVVAIHFSTEPREALDGRHFGTGARGAELSRVMESDDPRLKSRVYGYVNTGEGVMPEKYVGNAPHKVEMKNLYDADADPLHLLGRDNNDFESAVLDHGFDGYVVRGDHQGVSVMLGDKANNVRAEPQESKYRGADIAKLGEPAYTPTRQLMLDLAGNKNLPAGEMKGSEWDAELKRKEPALYEKLQASGMLDQVRGDKLYYLSDLAQMLRKTEPQFAPKDEIRSEEIDRYTAMNREQRDNAFEKIAQDYQNGNISFGQYKAYKALFQSLNDRSFTTVRSPEFKRWFGNSKVVDENGQPRVMFHGTANDVFDFRPREANAIFTSERPEFASTFASYAADRIFFPKDLKTLYTPAKLLDLARQANNHVDLRTDIFDDQRPFLKQQLFNDLLKLHQPVSKNVMPLFVKAERPFDYANEAQRNAVLAQTKKNGADLWSAEGRIAAGDWEAIEDPKVQKAIRDLGHDGFYVNESGSRNLAVYDPRQIKSAIGNNGEFNPEAPQIHFAPKQRIVGDDIANYTPAQQKAMEQVGLKITEPDLRERYNAIKQDFWKKLQQGIFDQFAPINKVSPEGYMLARQAKGSVGAFEAILRFGKLSIDKDGAYDADRTGGFIERIGQPLQGEVNRFFSWRAANRAEFLSAEDRERLFVKTDPMTGVKDDSAIKVLKTLNEGKANYDYTIQSGPRKGQVTRDRIAIFDDANRVFNEFQKNILDTAEKSGLIDKTTRPIWENEFYVPFYRVTNDEGGGFTGDKLKDGITRQEAFKRLKGGTNMLNPDLLQNVLMNWSHLIDASIKNRASRQILTDMASQGAAFESSEAAVKQVQKDLGLPDNNRTWFMEDGVKRHFLVEDKSLATALGSLEPNGPKGPISAAMSKFKHYLTYGTTISPQFKIRLLIRHTVQAMATAPLSYNAGKTLKQGWLMTRKDNQEYVSALASGALIRFGTMADGDMGAHVRAVINSGVDPATVLNTPQKFTSFVNRKIMPVWRAYQELGNRAEDINPAALYKQLRDQGKSHLEASYMARDIMDFSMNGSFGWVRFLAQSVPFFNARLQGLYKLGRAAVEDPRRFSTVVGAAAVMSVGLMLLQQDDPDWQKREDWDRDNFWWFKLGGVAYRIPRPFEVGAIATLAERGWESTFNPAYGGMDYVKTARDTLLNQLSLNPTPQLVKPILDVYANKNTFTGRPIESYGMQELNPDYRFNSSTSIAARAIGTAGQTVASTVGANFISPLAVDHLINGYFGWLGTMVAAASDVVAKPLSGQPTAPTPDYLKTATLGFASELPAEQSRFVSHMYDQATIVRQAYETYLELAKEGKTQEAQSFLQDNMDTIKWHSAAIAVTRSEAQLNRRIKFIENSNMSGDEKREAIQQVEAARDQMARAIK